MLLYSTHRFIGPRSSFLGLGRRRDQFDVFVYLKKNLSPLQHSSTIYYEIQFGRGEVGRVGGGKTHLLNFDGGPSREVENFEIVIWLDQYDHQNGRRKDL